MSRSFASVIKSKWNVSSHKQLWNRAFRSKEHVNLCKFRFTAEDSTGSCYGCEICDEWPDYGREEGYISIHKYDVSGRHGIKLYYGGQRKYTSHRLLKESQRTYVEVVKEASK